MTKTNECNLRSINIGRLPNRRRRVGWLSYLFFYVLTTQVVPKDNDSNTRTFCITIGISGQIWAYNVQILTDIIVKAFQAVGIYG